MNLYLSQRDPLYLLISCLQTEIRPGTYLEEWGRWLQLYSSAHKAHTCRKALKLTLWVLISQPALSQHTQFLHLSALAARPTWDAGLHAVDLVDGQEGVGWTLLALAGLLLDVVPRRAGHAGWARLLGTQRTGPARRGNSIHCVGHRDGVDLCHVIDELSALKQEARKAP